MPPTRVLLIDDLVLRAEVLAFGLSARPEFVVVGRLPLRDPELAQRCAAAPADVAVVALVEGPGAENAAEPGAGTTGPERAFPPDPEYLAELAAVLRRNHPGLRLIALVDPRDTPLVEALGEVPSWSQIAASSSLDELAALIVPPAGRSTR